jgi:lipopolysaccharide export system protein LptA
MLYKIFLAALITTLFPTLSYAQTNNDQPIEVSAGQALEWKQKDLQYIARGDVVITQGKTTVKADTVIADYREGANSKTEIWRLTATDNVIIFDTENTITGAQGVYLIDGGIATVTGQNLKLTTPEQVITANEKMTYAADKGTATAIGNAKVVQGNDTLTSARLNVFFKKDDEGKNALQKIDAVGRVKIVTPDETLTGDSGTYNAGNDTATVQGNVKIMRGPNTLEGTRANVNLTTKVSKIFGNEKTGGRVKGIFFPGSAPKETKE